MVKVNFYIGDKVVLTDSFDEQPVVRANYVFDGMKHYVGSVTTNDDGSFNYYLLYDDRSFYEAEYARFPRDNYGYLITINNYGDHPLDSFGTIKGFL